MLTCSSRIELVEAVRKSGAKRIGIDGIDGSGKTPLARHLSANLGIALVTLDNFLEKGQGRYVEFINYRLLSDHLASAGSSIIEGVCLLQVLGHINASIDLHIYIKRHSCGVWADESELEIQEPVDIFLEHERRAVSMFSAAPVSDLGLAEDVIRYHDTYRPHRSAQITYIVEVQ